MRLLTFILMALTSQSALAGSAAPGKVVNPIVNRAGIFFFSQTGVRSAIPTCEVYNRWAVDVNTPRGQSMMSLILTAYSQGKNVSIAGTGECGVAGDTEGIEFIIVN